MAESEHQNQMNDNFDLREILFKYLSELHWILLSVLVFLGFAFLYIRYTPPVYQSSTIIKILDNNRSGFKLPTDNISFFASNKINLENEIEVIKSSILLEKVIVALDLDHIYRKEGRFQSIDIGNEVPFQFVWLGDPSTIHDFSTQLELKLLPASFSIEGFQKDLEYGKNYAYQNHPFKVLLLDAKKDFENESLSYSVTKLTRDQTIKRVQSILTVVPVSDESELLKITVTSQNRNLAATIANTISSAFNQDGIDDRRAVHLKTIDFVNERFTFLFKELDSIENSKATYKRNEQLSDFRADAGTLLATKSITTDALNQAKIQLYLSEILTESLSSAKVTDLLPANVGIDKIEVAALVNQYNELVLKQQKMLLSIGESHPAIIDIRAAQLKLLDNLKSSLSTYKKALQSEINAISKTSSTQSSQYAALPFQEKAIRSIERQQEIKEMLYVLLLQKREEAAINLAIINPSIKVIDFARVNKIPISPRANITYLVAFSLGIGLPIGLLYLLFLFDTKIYSKKDVLNVIQDIPILAEIPSIKDLATKIVLDDRSLLSEAFRVLRSNLNYLTQNKKSSQVLFVTSSIKGEGKTFVSRNLAFSLSTLNKKVVLVGTDLRNPQLHNLFDTSRKDKGLSNYLIDVSNLDEIIVSGQELGVNFDVVFSGPIPPNPAELLSSGKMTLFFESLRQNYDYIVVDTAPCLLVTDTTSIVQEADVLLYLVRSNYTDMNLLHFIDEFRTINKITNIGLILNNIGEQKAYNYHYGYSYNYNYNYGYGADKFNSRPLWKRWLRALGLKRKKSG
ncbi:GumC family protein [Flavobacterium lacus]|uniref:non-specific protein-tyrosine kinase n=1 Tax=Flavobacterium lacus TaxID=1353778 RepID=A0A328WLM7_9FLAO|nr:tyrosine-protein kinase family protein [Flavobacterium lacus]RAR47252.1 capsular exopolysaccharide synthesis family protein [Flavobacterium lacus]